MKLWPCSWCSVRSWWVTETIQSHEMEVTHSDSPLQGDALCKSNRLFSMWSLQAQVCECGRLPTCSAHLVCPCKWAFFGTCKQVFASIYIRLFACVHKRPLYRSMAPFTHIHTDSCCILLLHGSSLNLKLITISCCSHRAQSHYATDGL